jgi:MSHA pilin protein MshA
MKNFNKQKGFTLIELVVVIVILGILAVTAAPKFIDLTSDAKASVVEAVKGSINSAADMAHAKALVASETGENGSISVGTSTIDLAYGWPTDASIKDLLVLEDMTQVSGSTNAGTFEHATAVNGTNCRVVYKNTNTSATVTTSGVVRPSITSTTETNNGC